MNNKLEQLINSSPVFVFMKGNKLWPQCGYSTKAVDILNYYKVEYDTFDVLSDDEVRQGIKEYANWPTFPQIYINGKLIGGSDILIELHQNQELDQILPHATK